MIANATGRIRDPWCRAFTETRKTLQMPPKNGDFTLGFSLGSVDNAFRRRLAVQTFGVFQDRLCLNRLKTDRKKSPVWRNGLNFVTTENVVTSDSFVLILVKNKESPHSLRPLHLSNCLLSSRSSAFWLRRARCWREQKPGRRSGCLSNLRNSRRVGRCT